jgi:hypothetical protein
MTPLTKAIVLIASMYFIIVGGWLLRPGKEPICIVCGSPALDTAIKVIGLALAVATLVAALRTPKVDARVNAGVR